VIAGAPSPVLSPAAHRGGRLTFLRKCPCFSLKTLVASTNSVMIPHVDPPTFPHFAPKQAERANRCPSTLPNNIVQGIWRCSQRAVPLLYLLSASSCGAPSVQIEQHADATPTIVVRGVDMSTQYLQRMYTLHTAVGYSEDGDRVRGFLDFATKALCAEFSERRPFDLLKEINFDIYLEKNSTEIDQAGALLSTKVDHGKYFAELHMLTPSVVPQTWMSKVGEQCDDAHYLRIVLHEYSSILLDQITRHKETGWRFFTAPSWFIQGYEEYVSLLRSTLQTRTVTLEKYKDVVRNHPERVRHDLTVQDAYVDGALLLLFMHERFGKERVQAILVSTKREFFDALTFELGMSVDRLYHEWLAWHGKL
jgi:hypothetical protein